MITPLLSPLLSARSSNSRIELPLWMRSRGPGSLRVTFGTCIKLELSFVVAPTQATPRQAADISQTRARELQRDLAACRPIEERHA